MCNRSRQLPQRSDAIGVRQCHLYLAVSTLAFKCRLFGSLAIRQVQHKGYSFIPFSLEVRATDQHWNTVSVLVTVLLLIRFNGPGRLHLGYTLLVGIAP